MYIFDGKEIYSNRSLVFAICQYYSYKCWICPLFKSKMFKDDDTCFHRCSSSYRTAEAKFDKELQNKYLTEIFDKLSDQIEFKSPLPWYKKVWFRIEGFFILLRYAIL